MTLRRRRADRATVAPTCVVGDVVLHNTHLRPLGARSQTAALSDNVHNVRKQRLKTADALLIWLDEQGRSLSDCTQAVLDRWAVTGPPRWAEARPFLVWAREQHMVGTLDFPARPAASPA